MASMITKLKNADKRKKRFLSMFTAMFMVFTTFGDSLTAFADIANTVDGIENITGNAEKNAELIDVPDAEDKFLGLAGDFTIFVKERFTVPEQAADIEGRLAAGGGIEIGTNNYTIGSRYTGSGASIIIGGGESIDFSKLATDPSEGAERKIVVIPSGADITNVRYKENTYISDDIIDYDLEFEKLSRLSKEISKYDSTGEIVEEWGNAKIVCEDEFINIINVSEEQLELLNKSSYLPIYIPGDPMNTYFIFNVEGKEIHLPSLSIEVHYGDNKTVIIPQDNDRDNPAAVLCGHILYNAYEATDVYYKGFTRGSLLAVNANVSSEHGGHISGSTIAKSAEGFGIQAGTSTFNPPKKIVVTPTPEIFVGKTNKAGTSYLEGAVLEITPVTEGLDLSKAIATCNNFTAEESKLTLVSKNSSVSIKGLPDGEYEMTEVSSPDRYTINNGKVSFTVKDGVTAESVVKMSDDISVVKISKKAVTGEDEVPGAVLKLTLEESYKDTSANLTDNAGGAVTVDGTGNVLTWKSGTNPTEFTGLPDGRYLLEESVAPDGYTVTGSFEFEINDGVVERSGSSVPSVNDGDINSASNTVTMKDELSKTVISKQTITDGTSEELEGAGLTLEYKGSKSFENVKQGEGSGADITVEDTKITWTSGTKPALIEGLPDGNYTLTEVRVPDGYEKAESIDFVIENGQSYLVINGVKADHSVAQIVMVDAEEAELSKIIISKQSVSGSAEVEGAHLTLTADDRNADFSKISAPSSVTVNESAKTLSWISGTASVTIEGLPDGSYKLEESVAPDGYTVTDAVDFTVEGGMVKEYPGNIVKMIDKFSEISVSKKDINGTDELDGAKLKIKLIEPAKNDDADLREVKVSGGAKSVYTGKDTDGKYILTFITDSETPAKITRLPDGKYEFTEIVSPDGYTLSEETIKFEIENGVPVSGKEIAMKDDYSSVSISKKAVSGEDEVPGAVLTLTLVKPFKTQGATLADQINDTVKAANTNKTAVTWTSGSEPLVLTNLPDGDYKLEESVAPDGYTVTGKVEFKVIDGIVTESSTDDFDSKSVTMVDEFSDIVISKQEMGGSPELPGAVLEVVLDTPEDENADLKDVKVSGGAEENLNKIVQSERSIQFVSGSTPTHLTKLPDGKYILTETTAPDGFKKTESVKFEVQNGVLTSGSQVQMFDKPSSIEFSKTDVADKEIPGAKLKLTLTKPAKNAEADLSASANTIAKISEDDSRTLEWTSGTSPVSIKKLPDGEYTLAESVAPDGYTVTDAVSFTIKDGEVDAESKTKVTMVDDYSSVTISKKEITDGPEIPGAKLTVELIPEEGSSATLKDVTVGGGAKTPAVSGNKIVFVSGDQPAVISKLPDGKYTLTETTSPDGYTVNDEVIDFEISNGKLVGEPVAMIDKPSEVTVSKKAVSGKDEIPGAVLKLTLVKAFKETTATLKNQVNETVKLSETSDRVITWTSGAEPVILSKLPDGEYMLEESVAPDGYTITDSIGFTIEDGKVVEYAENQIEMRDELSEVTISKQKVSGDELPGAMLTLTNNDGKSLEKVISASGSAITAEGSSISWKSGTERTVLKGIPDGSYTLTEDQAPLGFDIAESISFTVKNGEVIEYAENTIPMVDYEEAKPSEVFISKTDATGSNEVPGAHLTITASDSSADLSAVKSDVELKTDKNVISWISGDYPVLITGLPDGEYTLEESVAPDGYTVTGSQTFTIKDGIVNDKNIVVMKDELSEVSVSKVDINNSEQLPGAVLRITLVKPTKTEGATLEKVKVSGGASNVKADKNYVRFTSGSETAVVKGLPDGKYELSETTSPDGYTLNTEKIEFEISNGVLVDKDSLKMEDKPSEITISKTDITMEKEIPGAKLTLKLNQSYKDKKNLREFESESIKLADESGKIITWTSSDKPMVLRGLPDGEYVLQESVAPDGYTITGDVKFTVSDGVVKTSGSTVSKPEDGKIDSEKNSVIMVDKLSEVPFKKTNAAGKEIPGATLKLTIAEDKDLTTVESETKLVKTKNSVSWISETTETVIKGLPDGTYTLEETQAPDGYSVTESTTFTIKDGIPSKATVEMVDEYTKVTISKTNVAGKEIPGAKLTLRQISGTKNLSEVESEAAISINEDKDEITWTSGKTAAVLRGLPDGTYELEETVAPDKYAVTGSVKFELVNGSVQSVEAAVPRPEDSRVDTEKNAVIMVDELSKVIISKTDIADVEIPGAKLTVTLVDAVEKNASLYDVSVSGGATSVSKNGLSVSFVSGREAAVIEGLPDGKYTLTETQAPAGYEIAETVPFTVENGKVAEDTENNTVTMVDKMIVTTTTPVTTTETTTTTTEATTTPVTTTVTTTTEATTTTVTTTEATTTTTELPEPEFSLSKTEVVTGVSETAVTLTEATTTTPVTTPVTTTVTTTTTKATTTTPVTTTATTTTKATTTTPVTTTVTTTTTKATTTTPVTTTATTTTTKATTTTPVTTTATTTTTKATTTTPVTTTATTTTTKATTTTPVTTTVTTTTTKATTTTPVTTTVTTTTTKATTTTTPVTTTVTTTTTPEATTTTTPVTTTETTTTTTTPVTTTETTTTTTEPEVSIIVSSTSRRTNILETEESQTETSASETVTETSASEETSAATEPSTATETSQTASDTTTTSKTPTADSITSSPRTSDNGSAALAAIFMAGALSAMIIARKKHE